MFETLMSCKTCIHGDKDYDRKPCTECLRKYIFEGIANTKYEDERTVKE